MLPSCREGSENATIIAKIIDTFLRENCSADFVAMSRMQKFLAQK